MNPFPKHFPYLIKTIPLNKQVSKILTQPVFNKKTSEVLQSFFGRPTSIRHSMKNT